MDVKKGKLNIIVSVCFKIVTMIMVIFVKRTLIHICGNEVNGLNALYLSIIGFLSVAELGIGTAITFCMYRPIVEQDNTKVAALYHFFRKAYLLIGAIIFISGLALLPFLKYFAKDYSQVNANIYVTFVIMLISVVVTYLFSSKVSLINAYKSNYITTTITQSCLILQYVLQVIALYITKSFEAYLMCRIIVECVQWAIIEIVSRKKYGDIIRIKARVDKETTIDLKKNIKAMFMHKIGYVLVNTVDSVIISAFVGVVSLGEYSNYTMILSSMVGVITLVFTSLTSVIGHLCVKEDRETARLYCESIHLLNFIIGSIFFLGYYAIVDNLIAILFSSKLIVSKSISFVITLNGFVQFMRRSTLTFRDATGSFWGDRWKPLIEGIVNIVLSILLVNTIGVVGVIVATIITNLIICHVVEPHVLYKNAFNLSPNKFYLKNYAMMFAFLIMLVAENSLLQTLKNEFSELIINGLISVACSSVLCVVMILANKNQIIQLARVVKKG